MLTTKGHNVTASAPVVAAAAAAEAKVFWGNTTADLPAATATANSVTLKGATNTSAYVYCLVEKSGTAIVTTTTRRLSNATNATTNASNATNASTTTTATTTPTVDKWAAEKAYTASEWAAKYNAMRALTASTAFSFELTTNLISASHTYKWACMATSLNPVFA
jgi:hypothetical protein